MSDIPPEVADEIEADIRERQSEQNGEMFCPACLARELIEAVAMPELTPDGAHPLANVHQVPEMKIRFSKLSANSRMLHEDLTWKCGDCRAHMWSSVRITEAELSIEQERRGGLKYDPTSHPEESAARDRLQALGYLEEDV